jgi:site-specific DNA recombinase
MHKVNGLHKIGLYIRVSTEEQASNPEGSIKSQEQRLRQAVEFKNVIGKFGQVTDVFIDRAKSGKDTNRPELQRLLQAVIKREISLIMVTELSRLSRSIKDFSEIWELMRIHGCQFQSLREQFDTTTAAGEMVLFTMANLAQFERKQTAERITANLRARAARGLFNGGPVALGYKIDPDQKGTLAIDEPNAVVVKEIFATFLREGCLSKTGKSLNDRGIQLCRHRQGGGNKPRLSYFNLENLHFILTNKTYIAKRTVKDPEGDKTVKACWPPIIDEITFGHIQQMMKKNRYRFKSPSKRRYNYLLSGLATCQACGDRLTGKSANGRNNRFYYYEHNAITKRQAFLTKKFFKCRPGRFKVKDYDPLVWKAVERILTNQDLVKAILSQAQKNHQNQGNIISIQKLKNKVRGIEDQLEALSEHLSKIPKGVSPQPIFNQMKRLEGIKEESQKELEAQKPQAHSFDLPIAFKDYELFLKAIRQMAQKKDGEVLKSKIIQQLVHKVEIMPNGFKIHFYAGETTLRLKSLELDQIVKGDAQKAQVSGAPTSTFFNFQCSKRLTNGGPDRDRTDDLLHAMQALSQLSYRPLNDGSSLFYP